ncbi:hypothetical protein [Parendozoicomonas sp. Alg238-R29]|uniref:hypothetical protein n=1 Tax=Parendozoicomonas sp. Alg238-R29 TaxID=2993446 RepID=UPI00248DC110|nr:hypothetical protein [Parendozoicomonas sp. Alg238-R29]
MDYVEPFNAETDAEAVIQITQSLIENAESDIEIIEDQQMFFQLRARSLLSDVADPCEFTPEELKFSCHLETFSGVDSVLKEASSNSFALSAFLKWRAEKLGWRFGETFPKELNRLTDAGVSTINGKPATVSALIDFCVDKSIFNLEEGQGYFPLYWISEKLQCEPENFTYHSLLRRRLFRVISRPNFNAVTLINALIRNKMPNPLKRHKPEWDTLDLINFTGYFGNIIRGGKAISEVIAVYKNPSEYKIIPQVYLLAKFRVVEAIKAILERNLLHGRKYEFKRVSDCLKRNEIYVPVNREFVESSPENVSSFIREHFSADEALQMLPHTQRSEAEILQSMEVDTGARVAFATQQREEIRSTTDPVEKKRKLKAFLKAMVTTSASPEQMQNRLRKSLAELDINDGEEQYTADSVVSLFQGDEDISWLKVVYPIRLAENEELLNKLDNPEGPVRAVQAELMKRLSKDRSLLPKIIIGFKKVWHSDNKSYFWEMSKNFNNHSINPESGEAWTPEAVRAIYTKHCSDPDVIAFSTLSDDDWFLQRSYGKCSTKTFGEYFLSGIKNAESDVDKLDWVRRYMRTTYKSDSIEYLSDLLARLNHCDDIPELPKPYDSGTLATLFKDYPEDLEQLKGLSTDFWTDDELMNELRTRGEKSRQAKAELMRRAVTDVDLRMKVILISRTLSTMKDACFFSEVAKQYKRHKFPPPDTKEWNKQSAESFYQESCSKFPDLVARRQ